MAITMPVPRRTRSSARKAARPASFVIEPAALPQTPETKTSKRYERYQPVPPESAVTERLRKFNEILERGSANKSNVSRLITWEKGVVTDSLAKGSSTANMPPPKATVDGRVMIEDDRILEKQGIRYFPIGLAAEVGQVPRTTLNSWISAKVKFQGRALETYDSPTARKTFLTEDSVQRLAQRFVQLPSKKPAGVVVLGETKEGDGYIGIATAARTLGVDHHTMWLWTTQGKTPTDEPLDVIKCAASDMVYIKEKDIVRLKNIVPRSGLRRGPRRRESAQPS
jgi:hypothetical protein